MTWCRSVNGERGAAFRASVQHNQTLTSLAGIKRTHCNRLIIFSKHTTKDELGANSRRSNPSPVLKSN